MAWYDRLLGRTSPSEEWEKLNPSQPHIAGEEGGSLSTRKLSQITEMLTNN